jgi:aminopeptidase N
VEFTTPAGRTRKRIEFSHARDEFSFPLDAKPVMVRFDPEHRVLGTVKFSKTVAELLYQLKNDPEATGRIAVSRELEQSPASAEIAGAFRETLKKDSFWGVREAAARALGQMKTDAARDSLAEGLRDRDARVRQAALRALGLLKKDKKAAKLADEAFKRDPNGLVAAEASLAVGKIQAKGAREFLEKAVERASDQDVIRRYALRGMGELGDKREWETVARWLPYGRPPETRMAAIDALLKLGKDQHEKTAARLIALIDDPDFFVKQRAMYALGAGNFQQARTALMKSAETETDSRVRRSARIALDRLAAAASKQQASEGSSELQPHVQGTRQHPLNAVWQSAPQAAFSGQQ